MISCPACLKYDSKTHGEGVIPTRPGQPFETLRIDVQYMPDDGEYKYLVEARCDLTGYVLAKALRKATAAALKDWFVQNIMLEYRLPLKVTVDGGPENKAEFAATVRQLGVKLVQISPYNPRAQEIVEVGHRSIAAALSKLCNGRKGWRKFLKLALFADRTSHRTSHGHTPFYLVYGWEPIVPLETDIPTWRVVSWTPNQSTEEALDSRLRAILGKQQDIQKAIETVAQYRQKLAIRIHDASLPRPQPLRKGDLVLVYDHIRRMSHSTTAKLAYR